MQRQALRRTTLAATLVLLLTAAGSAGAKPRAPLPVHNARYCEILELRGAIPDATVTVWNTIGLNNCPPALWDPLDAGELAKERGDTLVILNGPRHFLMDSAAGRVGGTHSFHGLRTRKVATIPIRRAADLARAPYAERRISRVNTWHWRKGRRVFLLLAPDGSNYVMQSYSQIVDPTLKIGQLRSIGRRLTLPPGWTYRSRVLSHSLTLRARGGATIVQDDLTNTYQRVPPYRKAPKPKRRAVHVTGMTKAVASPSSGTIEDKGTITGAPFGRGTVDLVVKFAGSQVTGTFRIDSTRGSAFGNVDMTYVISGGEITFTGTAEITGGTGTYWRMKGRDLRAYDHNTLDGQNGTLTLDGSATY